MGLCQCTLTCKKVDLESSCQMAKCEYGTALPNVFKIHSVSLSMCIGKCIEKTRKDTVTTLTINTVTSYWEFVNVRKYSYLQFSAQSFPHSTLGGDVIQCRTATDCIPFYPDLIMICVLIVNCGLITSNILYRSDFKRQVLTCCNFGNF